MISLAPLFIEGYLGRAGAFMDYGHQEGQKASRRDLQRAIRIAPTSVPVCCNELRRCCKMCRNGPHDVTSRHMSIWHTSCKLAASSSSHGLLLHQHCSLRREMPRCWRPGPSSICRSVLHALWCWCCVYDVPRVVEQTGN